MARKSSDPDTLLAMAAMLTNTVNPTGVESGKQHNVVPGVVTLKLDCRLLPGFSGDDVVKELEAATGETLNIEVIREAQGHESPFQTPLFEVIKKQLEAADPGCVVVPHLVTGFTDAQWVKKFGTICYGFTPVKLPEGMSLPKLYHGHNERIPVDGFRWGLDVFMKTVREFCQR
jgi:acetylornithine deacetylase/succinyl-diaminopimelate desuccinylase-like protein